MLKEYHYSSFIYNIGFGCLAVFLISFFVFTNGSDPAIAFMVISGILAFAFIISGFATIGLKKSILIEDSGITLKTYLGNKIFNWSDITSVGSEMMFSHFYTRHGKRTIMSKVITILKNDSTKTKINLETLKEKYEAYSNILEVLKKNRVKVDRSFVDKDAKVFTYEKLGMAGFMAGGLKSSMKDGLESKDEFILELKKHMDMGKISIAAWKLLINLHSKFVVKEEDMMKKQKMPKLMKEYYFN
jgi:hypothetical protein